MSHTWFFLAMAHHGLGHGEEAKKWLDKAVAWTDKVVAKRDNDTERAVPWNRRLTLKLFREEAEALLKTSGPSRQPETVPTERQGKE